MQYIHGTIWNCALHFDDIAVKLKLVAQELKEFESLLKNPELEEEFMKMTKEAGIVGIKGHRSVGGFRASMYNALPLESVKVLTGVMKEFAQVKA